jgi:hypothetical protein
MEVSPQDRARKIKIIIFDVDGVFTDGTIWLVPGVHSGNEVLDGISDMHNKDIGFGVQSKTMVEAKGYSAHDGLGISLAGRSASRVVSRERYFSAFRQALLWKFLWKAAEDLPAWEGCWLHPVTSCAKLA